MDESNLLNQRGFTHIQLRTSKLLGQGNVLPLDS
ncbi:MAG: hypothetical protein K0S80_4741 [Neobacillus sp.]|nr:hypothetical protein [Neobacillus sp.]